MILYRYNGVSALDENNRVWKLRANGTWCCVPRRRPRRIEQADELLTRARRDRSYDLRRAEAELVRREPRPT